MKFNHLIPELSVVDLGKSLDFYINVLGFKVEYGRPEDRFSFLSFESAQIMIEEINGHWQTDALEYPLGRGINFQVEVSEIDSMIQALHKFQYPLYEEPQERWYQVRDGTRGQRQFLVQDPDGYLLRFFELMEARES